MANYLQFNEAGGKKSKINILYVLTQMFFNVKACYYFALVYCAIRFQCFIQSNSIRQKLRVSILLEWP